MYTTEDLMKKITSEKDLLERLLSKKRTDYVKNQVVKFLLNTGIAVDYALPYIVSVIITASLMINVPFLNNYIPFTQTEFKSNSYIETIDTSSGYHIQNNDKGNYYYDENTIEFSTGWNLNEYGVYERKSITYIIDENVDLTDKERILYSTREELEQTLKVADIQTIQKNALVEEDKIYDEDAIILVNHFVQNGKTFYVDKTPLNNIAYIALFILVNFILGTGFLSIRESKIKVYFIRDILEKKNYSYYYMDEKELKELLKFKRENLELLNPNIKSLNKNKKGFYLRKVRGDTHE